MYSLIASEHFNNPRRLGPLTEATHKGTAGIPGEGPYVVLWLELTGNIITGAAYKTYGCPAAIASASMLAQLVEGREVADALELDDASLTEALDGLPEGKEHCPRLAVEALVDALNSPI
jgi:nitrogen fixation protein NifU and related proteins